MGETLQVAGIPFALTPSPGTTWSIDADTVTVRATPHSDIFNDPGGDTQANAETQLNAATLLGAVPSGDFQLSARVSVGFADTFDAGVLMLWLDEQHWGKLCFEFSPDREPMVVSVVARGVADDANAFVVDGDAIWLRISRVGQVFSYHASTDGVTWRMVRAFALDSPGTVVRVGFEAQSPMGDGCEVAFHHVAFSSTTLADLRDGT